MLEVRYNTDTKQLTAWCGDPEQFGNLDRDRPEEAVAVLDITIPIKPIQAILYDEASQSLIDNPDYVEPEPLAFTASPPGAAVGKRLKNIEDFLERLVSLLPISVKGIVKHPEAVTISNITETIPLCHIIVMLCIFHFLLPFTTPKVFGWLGEKNFP